VYPVGLADPAEAVEDAQLDGRDFLGSQRHANGLVLHRHPCAVGRSRLPGRGCSVLKRGRRRQVCPVSSDRASAPFGLVNSITAGWIEMWDAVRLVDQAEAAAMAAIRSRAGPMLARS